MVVLGNKTHEVRDLPDDNTVGPSQAAGRCQVAAGVAGLQSSRSCGCTGTDSTGATQVGRIYVYQPCRACWKKAQHTQNDKLAIN